MVTIGLYVDWMNAFPVDKIIFVLVRCLNPDMCGIYTTNNAGKTRFKKKLMFYSPFVFVWGLLDKLTLFSYECSEISLITLDTIESSTPNVCPITCRKLPLAENRSAMRTWSWVSSEWERLVLRYRSFNRSDMKFTASLQNPYLALNSLSRSPSILNPCWR